MTGTWRDTLLNIVVFAYIGWLVWLWFRPTPGGQQTPPPAGHRPDDDL